MNNIKKICNNRNISFQQMGDDLGLKYSRIYYLLNIVNAKFTLKEIELICNYLNITPYELFEWAELSEINQILKEHTTEIKRFF